MSTARTPAVRRVRSSDRFTKEDYREEVARLETHLEDRQALVGLLRSQTSKADEELQEERNACLQLTREVDMFREKEESGGAQTEKSREAFTRLRSELQERDSSLMGYAEQVAEVTDHARQLEA